MGRESSERREVEGWSFVEEEEKEIVMDIDGGGEDV